MTNTNFTVEDLLNNEFNLKNSLTKYWDGYCEMYGEEPENRRHPDTVLGSVIVPSEINRFYKEGWKASNGQEMLLTHGFCVFSNDNFTVNTVKRAMFFTDDPLFNYELLGKYGFHSCSFGQGLPFTLGTGRVLYTAEQFTEHFYKDQRVLKSVEELVGYLNNFSVI